MGTNVGPSQKRRGTQRILEKQGTSEGPACSSPTPRSTPGPQLGSLTLRPSVEPHSPPRPTPPNIGPNPLASREMAGGGWPGMTAPREAAKPALLPEANGRHDTERRRAKLSLGGKLDSLSGRSVGTCPKFCPWGLPEESEGTGAGWEGWSVAL